MMSILSESALHLPRVSGPLKKLCAALLILFFLQLWLTLGGGERFHGGLVVLVPMFTFVTFALAAYRLISRTPASFLTPIPIFLIWSAAVFGFGPLYQWLAPDWTKRASAAIFSTNIADYVWVALLNTTGLLLTVSGLTLMLKLLEQRRNKTRRTGQPPYALPSAPSGLGQLFTVRQLAQAGFSALAVAVALRFSRYGLGVPIDLPAFLSFVERAGWVAVLFLGMAGGRRGGGGLLAIAIAAAIGEGLVGLVIGMRSEALAPLVLLFIGHYIGSGSLRTLLVGAGVVILSLLLVTPVVKEIRLLTWSGAYQGSMVTAVTEAAERQATDDPHSEPAFYSVWRRLDYSPWQAEMMRLHDFGAPGDTYRFILWTFVPRFIAPQKPVFTVGTDIGYAVQGVRQSSSFSGTVYGEMYWNGGWLSVVISSLVYGLLLGLVGIGTFWLFIQRKLIPMMIATIGLLYGFVVDETFSVSVIGKAIVFFGLVFVFRFADSFIRALKRGRSVNEAL